MSYDLRIWSAVIPSWSELLSEDDGWAAFDQSYVLEKKNWQIIIGDPDLVEEEDIPEDVFTKLPGIRYLTDINLEPIHAPKTAHTLLHRLANRVAKESLAIVEDPQEETLITPRGVHRIQPETSTERISVLKFSWWFNESPILEEEGFRNFVDTLERLLPEALPRRYGRSEPPQFRYEDEGKEGFIRYLNKRDLFLVWYPHYPVLSLHLGTTWEYGPEKQGYRANHISVSIHSTALTQPGWKVALYRFWHGLSGFIMPFYGEIRLMNDYILQRGRLWIDGKTEEHPISVGWWRGIPHQLGQAAVIGEPYTSLWPRFERRSEERNGLHFISVDDWLSRETIAKKAGSIPKDIVHKYPYKGYSRKWPFDGPYAE